MDKETIHSQLKTIGVNPGDVLWVRIDLGDFGYIKGFKRQDYLNLILDYLGPEGTLATISYSESKFSFLNSNLPIFDPKEKSTSGAFPNIMLKHPKAIRSSHPTNSIVAIGKYAQKLTNRLDENSGSYEYFKRVVDLNGKILIVGCSAYPGILTHGVQIELGFHKKKWYRGLIKTRLPNGDVFTNLEPGGCSSDVDNLYPFYIRERALRIGDIGQAYSLCMNAPDAYRIDKKILQKYPYIIRCKDPDCFDCRAGSWSQIWYLPIYILKRLFNKYTRKYIRK